MNLITYETQLNFRRFFSVFINMSKLRLLLVSIKQLRNDDPERNLAFDKWSENPRA